MPFGNCKGSCETTRFADLVARKSGFLNRSFYSNGCGRCSSCEKFFIPGVINCPCCNRLLKTRPRESKDRRLFLESLVKRY